MLGGGPFYELADILSAAAAAVFSIVVFYRSSVLKYFVSKEFLLELNHP
jgi:hypothetical protein